MPSASQDLFLWCVSPLFPTVGMLGETASTHLTRRDTRSKGHRMITADIHAELIAAFLGDDEPCYGECQCAACRALLPRSNPYERTIYLRAAAVPDPPTRPTGRRDERATKSTSSPSAR